MKKCSNHIFIAAEKFMFPYERTDVWRFEFLSSLLLKTEQTYKRVENSSKEIKRKKR